MFADADAFNKKMKVLFLGIGSVEGPGTKNFSEQLTKAGINNVYFESPGTAHEWLTWRRCLAISRHGSSSKANREQQASRNPERAVR